MNRRNDRAAGPTNVTRRLLGAIALLALVGAAFACGPAQKPSNPVFEAPPRKRFATERQIRAAADLVRPLHHRLGVPQPGDWLSIYPEPGQTFDEYTRATPVVPTESRHTLYIQPLGEFTNGQRRVLAITADFMRRYSGWKLVKTEQIP